MASGSTCQIAPGIGVAMIPGAALCMAAAALRQIPWHFVILGEAFQPLRNFPMQNFQALLMEEDLVCVTRSNQQDCIYYYYYLRLWHHRLAWHITDKNKRPGCCPEELAV